MKPSKLYEALHALIGERVPLHIWGACGVGKSQLVAQVADDLDFEFLDVRAVQLDPVDLRGLPRIKDDQTQWVPPKFLPTAGKGILFLDELTSAPQMTQAGCYQLVLDRKLGEYVLPGGWVVIAAGNPASERGVHFSMPRPLRNRFVHLELEADLNDWCKWAVGAGVRPEIIAFLRSSQTCCIPPMLLPTPMPGPLPAPGRWPPMFCAALLNGRRPRSFPERASSRRSCWTEQWGLRRRQS